MFRHKGFHFFFCHANQKSKRFEEHLIQLEIRLGMVYQNMNSNFQCSKYKANYLGLKKKKKEKKKYSLLIHSSQ